MGWLFFLVALALLASAGALVQVNRIRFGRRVAREENALLRSAATASLPVEPSGLPAPVARYRSIAVSGHAPIHALRMHHAGTFVTSPTAKASPIRGAQLFTADPPGFVWTGRIRMAPGLWVDARDMAIGGKGNMRVAIDDTIPIADAWGPSLDQAAALRLLAEMAWFPTALFDARYVTWAPIDESHARATLRFGSTEVSAVFEFGPDGLPRGARGERYDDKGELHPWGGFFRDYRSVSGVLAPFDCEVYWDLPSGRFTYAHWLIESMEFEPASKGTSTDHSEQAGPTLQQ